MNKLSVGIVDYGMGNLWSVKKAMDRINIKSLISDNPLILKSCAKLILPGVGHFGNAIRELKRRNLFEFLQETVDVKNTFILGICLGMQLMTKFSEEGFEKGFEWFDFNVVRFNLKDKNRFKIPHVGWNTLKHNNKPDLLRNITELDEFYFVHSYHIPSFYNSSSIALTRYESEFISVIGEDNKWGVQFHPEKSHRQGEKILQNFINL